MFPSLSAERFIHIIVSRPFILPFPIVFDPFFVFGFVLVLKKFS